MDDLVDRLDAASRDERLADGMLYREAAKRIIALTIDHARYWHKIMQRTDKQADRIAELEAENKRIVSESKQCHQRNDELVSERIEMKAKLDRVRGLAEKWRDISYKTTNEYTNLHGCADELQSALGDEE